MTRDSTVRTVINLYCI